MKTQRFKDADCVPVRPPREDGGGAGLGARAAGGWTERRATG